MAGKEETKGGGGSTFYSFSNPLGETGNGNLPKQPLNFGKEVDALC
jgi:hypothetical protein